MAISVRVDTSELRKALEELEERAQDLTEPLGEMAEVVLQDFAKNRVLLAHVRLGRLLRSFSERGAPGNIYVVTPTEASVGSQLDYAEAFETRYEVLPNPRTFHDRFGQILADFLGVP